MYRSGELGSRVVRKVLVVDDDVEQAEALSMLLQVEGFETATATSGPQALFQVAKMQPDAVILDIGMPGMSGIQVAREMALRGLGASTRLVALTGYGDDTDRLATSQVGFEAHLSKPVDVQALLEALRRPLVEGK